MKALFAIVLIVLVVATFFTWRSLPDVASDVPVLHWATDGNPARVEQIRTFRKWLRKNDLPDIEVRLDSVDWSPDKTLVQGVAGVAADLLDHVNGPAMRFLQAVGLLEDVTEDARRLGFDLSQTYASLKDSLSVNGRQYTFPCNVVSFALWVNVEEFERVGMEPPPRCWTFEEFERVGKEYVRRANPPGRLQRHFFSPDVNATMMASTIGGAIYNETQSACVIDSPAYRRALGLKYKWTYEDRLLPTAADRGTFTSTTGYGGAEFAMFGKGNFAMVRSGRYALIAFRQFTDERRKEGRAPMRIAVSEEPYGDFFNSYIYTRASAVYAGGKHKELAMYFMAYFASDDYNMTIVRDADGLPPCPKHARTEEFLRPADRPEEWQHPWGSIHEVFADVTAQAIGPEFSPFVLDAVVERHVNGMVDRHMSHMLSLEETTARMQRLVNDEIQRSLAENPAQLPLYNERVATQKRIDDLRARGEKVPLSWITNDYWRKYYTLYNLADETK